MSYLTEFEIIEFCKALTKLTKEFGVAITGKLQIQALEDYEMSDYDFYSPVKHAQSIEWSLHRFEAVEQLRAVDASPRKGSEK